MRCILFSVLLIIITGCGQSNNNTPVWKSNYRDLSFQYGSPWKTLPTLDTKVKTLTGVIDYKDGKSYVIQITDDVSTVRLPNKKFFEETKKTMLQANSDNQLLSEDSAAFHGYKAYRQAYLMNTQQWGLLKQSNTVIGTGSEFVSIQISFPTTEKDYEKATIPDELIKFDQQVKFKLK